MDNADYVELALRIANADLGSVAALRATLHEEPWWAERAHTRDLILLRTTAAALRVTLSAAVDGDAETVLTEVNALLAAHPPRPRLSTHGSSDAEGAEPNWHLHVAEPQASPAKEVAAAAAWGLAQGVVRYGLHRWGRCAAAGCSAYFLDTSTNQAKRFCSARCANRAHVAAFRARRRVVPG